VNGSRVARRYAQAAFEIALEQDTLDDWQSDLNLFGDALSDARVSASIESGRIPVEQKRRILHSAFAELAELRRNFLLLLVIRKRLSYIGQIATEFGRLVNEHRRISVAKVTTAVPLDDDRRALMQQWLAKATDRNVNLDERVDESILGGVVVQIGDRRFIASLVDQLEVLRERMSLAQ
jgi:F-type H+-transporting ATPase subunit delta